MSANQDDYLRALAAEYERGLKAPTPTSGNDRKVLIAEINRMLAEMGDADQVGKMSLEAQRQKLMATSGNDEVEEKELPQLPNGIKADDYAGRQLRAYGLKCLRHQRAKQAKAELNGNDEVEAMCLALSGGFENRRGMDPYVLAGVNFIRKQAAQIAELEQHNRAFRRANDSWAERYAELEDQIAELQKDAELGKIVRRLFDRTGSAVTVEVAETIQAELFRELSAALANRSADSETIARPETE